MVEALYLALEDCFEDKAIEFIDSYKILRKVLVNELLTDMKLYKLENTKTMKKTLKAMLNDGQRLCLEILLAASRIFKLECFMIFLCQLFMNLIKRKRNRL